MDNQKYAIYLKSEHWQETARMMKQLFPYCGLCGDETKKRHVHHRNYSRLGRERAEDLIVLCSKCHRRFHNQNNKEPIWKLGILILGNIYMPWNEKKEMTEILRKIRSEK